MYNLRQSIGYGGSNGGRVVPIYPSTIQAENYRMYAFCVANVAAIAPLRAGQPPATELRYPATESIPDSGEKFKFEPDDRRPLAPGTYLLMGKVISGIFPGERGPISWRRLNGVAIPCTLGDGEKMLAAMVKSLQK